MSNLTDLLPSGAGGKQVSFTASGTIGDGVTVGLNSDGTVTAVGIFPESFGSPEVFESAAVSGASGDNMAAVYDSGNDRVVVFYRDQGNSNYGTAVVGTISGTSISFGSPVVYESAAVDYVRAAFDAGAGKTVTAYRDGGNSNYGTAVVGTVSGTSISFGATAVFESANVNVYGVAFDSSAGKVVISYIDYGNNAYGTAIVGTVSGTSISFGSATVFDSVNLYTSQGGITYNAASDVVVMAYRDASVNSNWGAAKVGTVSGTSISFGSKAYFENGTISGSAGTIAITYDSTNGKVVTACADGGNSNRGTAAVGTVSGTSISFGTPVVFETGEVLKISATYDATNNKINIVYADSGNSSKGTLVVGAVSGTTISFETPVIFNDGYTNGEISATFDSAQSVVFIAYADDSNSSYGTGKVFKNEYSNSTDFIGIADAAISNTASGNVTLKGGIATNSSLLPSVISGSLGSETTNYTQNSQWQATTFDSSNNKVVVAFRDAFLGGGRAAVGTVSGTGLSFGTSVEFNGDLNSIAVAFDSSNNKVVIVFRDGTNSNYPTAIVGTVSGTSISFGTKVVLSSVAAGFTSTTCAFDSSNNKIISTYRSGATIYVQVGTVSGTNITFGSSTTLAGEEPSTSSSIFDSNSNKTVVVYRDASNSNYGTAVVITTSGTSASFGTPVPFTSSTAFPGLPAFDSSNNKVVVPYVDDDDSDKGKAVVGTVSGTSISFGDAVTFETGATAKEDHMAAAFDSNLNVVAIVYEDADNSNAGTYVGGTVSGTSITFNTPAVFNAGGSEYNAAVFDSSQNTVVISYSDDGNSGYSTSIGLQLASGVPSLTPGATYYVQDDGTLSTTSSSVTAGKALSSTSINLEYNS